MALWQLSIMQQLLVACCSVPVKCQLAFSWCPPQGGTGCAPLPAFHSGALELRKVKTNAHKLFSLSSVTGSAEAEDMRLKLIGLYHSSAGGRWGSRRVLDTCMHAAWCRLAAPVQTSRLLIPAATHSPAWLMHMHALA